jgi:hypothetical protein
MSSLNIWFESGPDSLKKVSSLVAHVKRIFLTSLIAFSICGTSVDAQVSANNDSVVATPSFPFDADSLKRGTRGVEVEKLVNAISKSKPPIKDEFETREEFEARIQKWEGKKILGNVDVNSRVAVIVNAVTLPSMYQSNASTIQYDAENEVMTLKLQAGIACSGIMLSRVSKPKREYIATNSYGVKQKVLLVDENRACLQFDEGGIVTSAEQEFSFKVPRKVAENTKFLMSLAIIGRITMPYAQIEESQEGATIKFPIEKNIVTRTLVMNVDSIWVVNPFSGEILTKR